MKLTIIEATENKVKFNVSGLDLALANALRRIVISEIPTMAIESVTYYENSSILNDEILSLRLGLMPIKTDLKTYIPVSDCTCEGKGCAKCTVTLSMDMKGPGIVYSGELKSTDPEIMPVHDKIPLAKITPEQSVKFEARAELGTGKRHMKWQGGLASYELKEDGSFDFFIESFNQLELPELIDSAFNIFNQKIEDLKAGIKEK
ncbi:MAG: DNA-directed RNA polymerase subunit D [Candidatus Altiarchaeia archaeon]